MYTIIRLLNGEWAIECRIQDGTERWRKPTRKAAIQSLISAARTLNGSYITEDSITFMEQEEQPPRTMTADEAKLLDDIRAKRKILVDHDDKRLRYNITDKECDMIVAIREGRLDVVTGDQVDD